MNMVTLTISYLSADDCRIVEWSTDPMSVEAAMDRVMRFVQVGVDVITHHDSGTMDVLLMHRVTGIKIVPVAG